MSITDLIEPVARTATTVTLTNEDYELLLAAALDAQDVAAARNQAAKEQQAGGYPQAKANYLTRQEAERILAGDSAVLVWRGKRGLKQRELAERAGISVSYLSEIESGHKTGAVEVLGRIAAGLGVTIDDLVV